MHRQEWFFIGQLMVLVVFAGSYAFMSISSPINPDLSIKPPAVAVSESFETSESSEDRAPASIALTSKSLKTLLNDRSVSTWDWNCEEDRPQEFKTDSMQMRLKGLCNLTDSMNIVNSTNGYTATIFNNEGKQFSTDFIQLNEGENILKFTAEAKDGQLRERIIRVIKTAHAQEN